MVLKSSEYFLLGDYGNTSTIDSRFYGGVDLSHIIGEPIGVVQNVGVDNK